MHRDEYKEQDMWLCTAYSIHTYVRMHNNQSRVDGPLLQKSGLSMRDYSSKHGIVEAHCYVVTTGKQILKGMTLKGALIGAC